MPNDCREGDRYLLPLRMNALIPSRERRSASDLVQSPMRRITKADINELSTERCCQRSFAARRQSSSGRHTGAAQLAYIVGNSRNKRYRLRKETKILTRITVDVQCCMTANAKNRGTATIWMAPTM